jgi:hypothetical protein
MEVTYPVWKTKMSAPNAWPTSALGGGLKASYRKTASIKACYSVSLADA